MTDKLITVFMGTPAFAVPSLEVLARLTDLRLVITQPDRPAGRGRRMEPPPVKVVAAGLGIEVVQPDIVKGKRFAAEIGSRSPDLIVTAAFGRILGKSLLATPPLGCINVHASILPRYRGAAPINRAIVNGEKETGVSIMRMDEGLDSGPVFVTSSVEILPDETAGDLTDRLARLGAQALADLLPGLGSIDPVIQDHGAATHAPPIRKQDGEIPWGAAARKLHDHVRGFHPWPCASTVLDGSPLKVHRTAVVEESGNHGDVGVVLSHTPNGLDVACGEGVLRLLDLQLPGKKRLDPGAFHAGRRVPVGTMLGRSEQIA